MTTELTKAAHQALEACPFCGADPQDARHIEYGRWAVTCRCGASGASANTGPNATDAAKIKAYSDARTTWNTRALTHPAQPTHITWDASGNRCVNGVPAEGGEAWAKTASELNHFAHTGKWPEDSTAPPASQAQAQQPSEPNCDRSACGDFSPGPCDHPDCHALRKQQPSGVEVVTRESALEAIEHVEQHNGPGRADEARRMLASPKPEPMTEQQRGNLVMEHLGLPALMGDKMSPLDAFTLGIEATERFYGITKGEA